MTGIRVLSAGAAQAVVEKIAESYTHDTGREVNGYAAMKWLAESPGSRDIGITQITEILANKGVTYSIIDWTVFSTHHSPLTDFK